MKMPTLPKMPKMPRLPKLPKPQPKRLNASARRAAQPAFEDYDEEPTTRLSSAFVVVLILHVVAVGGIYAFNSIKAHRRGNEAGALAQPADTARSTAPAQAAAANTAPEIQRPVERTPVAAPEPPPTRITPVSGSRVYHVRSGDTLSGLAAQYGVTVEDFQQANGLKSVSDIRVGQALNIPSPSAKKTETARVSTPEPAKASSVAARKTQSTSKAATPASSASYQTYTVKKGDNPVAIARKFKVSYESLLKLNKIDDPRRMQIDQVLKIPNK